MTSSGAYTFNPALSDIVLDAFERCDIKPTSITPDHMFSARRSLNFVLAKWSNRLPNQWLTQELATPLINGHRTYLLPAGTVAVFETFTRNYQLGEQFNIVPIFETTMGSPIVVVNWINHGLEVDAWVSVTIHVAVGGITIQGFYQVISVTGADTFTIRLKENAQYSETGGAVPSYDTIAGDATVNMVLANHGFEAGEPWVVYEQLRVGGLTLLGDYMITSATNSSLTFEATSPAGFSETLPENDGFAKLASSETGVLPQDRMMTPIGRQEWVAIPSKSQPGTNPSSYWFERLIQPVLHIWPVPDLAGGPQELHIFIMRQLHDANPQHEETPDIPYRFEDAFCAELAAHLALKWKPDKVEILKAAAMESWAEAAQEDRERVVLSIIPQLGAYFR